MARFYRQIVYTHNRRCLSMYQKNNNKLNKNYLSRDLVQTSNIAFKKSVREREGAKNIRNIAERYRLGE